MDAAFARRELPAAVGAANATGATASDGGRFLPSAALGARSAAAPRAGGFARPIEGAFAGDAGGVPSAVTIAGAAPPPESAARGNRAAGAGADFGPTAVRVSAGPAAPAVGGWESVAVDPSAPRLCPEPAVRRPPRAVATVDRGDVPVGEFSAAAWSSPPAARARSLRAARASAGRTSSRAVSSGGPEAAGSSEALVDNSVARRVWDRLASRPTQR
jgi:hypothetical protein